MDDIIKDKLANDHANKERNRVVGDYLRLLRSGVDRTPKLFRPESIVMCRDEKALGATGILEQLCIGIFVRDAVVKLPQRPNPDQYYAQEESGVFELEAYSPPNDPFSPEGEHYYSVVKPHNVEAIEAAREAILTGVTNLWRRGANIICVNEIGYPAFKLPEHDLEADELEQTQADNQRLLEGDAKLRQQLQNLANGFVADDEGNPVEEGQSAVIVAGSYHDPQEMTNVAVIFFPQIDNPSEPSPVSHRKLTTAKSPRIGEILRTPKDPKFPLYTTHLGVVSVLICLDAYDLNMYMRQMHMAVESHKESPSIILVPSYSHHPLAEACKDLSEAARAIVIHANPQVPRMKAAVYFCGNLLFSGDTEGEHLAEKIHSPPELNTKRHDMLVERMTHLVETKTRM